MEYLTESGLKKIKEKLKYLKNIKRPEIAEKLAIAREFGDLAENAEYTSLKEEQGLMEAEIRRLENILKSAVVIKDKTKKEIVQISSQVIIEIDKKRKEYVLVGPEEVNPAEGKISIHSPLGKALLNKKVGQSGVLQTPSGKKTFKIIAVF